MRRVLMAIALAAATIGLGTPASAAVTLTSYTGPDLATKIKASTTNTLNDVNTVYGSTNISGSSADVTFTANGTEAIHITDGAGFAAITDAGTGGLYSLLIDVTSADFNQYMFSLQLVEAGNISVQYLLASGGGWSSFIPPGGISQMANADKTYLLAGNTFTAILISSTSAIKLFKQNSITLGSVPAPVPEPATWALMLLGFGGMGLALRRGRRHGQKALMQIA